MFILDYNCFLKKRDPQLLRNLESGWGENHPIAAVDPLNPFPAPYQGFIRESFKIDEETRTVYALIPPHYPSSGPAYQIFLDDGEDAAEFLATSRWTELAEEKGFILIVFESGGKWQTDRFTEREMRYYNAWQHFEYLQQIFITGFSHRYLIGYGKGAQIAALVQASYPTGTAVSVIYGVEDLNREMLEGIGAQPSANAKVLKRDVPVAALLIGKKEIPSNLLSYFRRAGDCRDFVGNGKFGDVYRPELRYYKLTKETAPVWEVCADIQAHFPEKESPDFFDLVFSFTAQFARGFGATCNAPLIACATQDELMLKRHTAVVDGKLREWWIYVPENCQDNHKKYPLLVFMHGYSGNGRDYLLEGELHKIANERGFLLAAPTGYRGAETVFRNGRAMQPQWNGHMESKPGDTDDIHFLDVMMDQLLEQYPIDAGRCYLGGVSNGAMIVCKAMFYLTDRFAAYCASSGNMNDTHNPDENILPMDLSVMPNFRSGAKAAFWVAKGEFDGAQKGMDTTLEPGKSNYELLKRVALENDMSFKAPAFRKNGIWNHSTWVDTDCTPILRFSLGDGCPHGFPNDLAWQMWDEFFCHFYRDKAGVLRYIP